MAVERVTGAWSVGGSSSAAESGQLQGHSSALGTAPEGCPRTGGVGVDLRLPRRAYVPAENSDQS